MWHVHTSIRFGWIGWDYCMYIYIHTCCTPSHQIALHHLALCMLSCCFSVFPFMNCRICVYINIPTYLSTYTFCTRAICWRPACSSIGIRCLSPLQGFHLNSHSHSLLPPFHRFPGKSFGFSFFGRKSSSILEGNPHASPATLGIYNGPPSGQKTQIHL